MVQTELFGATQLAGLAICVRALNRKFSSFSTMFGLMKPNQIARCLIEARHCASLIILRMQIQRPRAEPRKEAYFLFRRQLLREACLRRVEPAQRALAV